MIRIFITSGEFHTDKSRIVLNNNGVVITMCISIYLYINGMTKIEYLTISLARRIQKRIHDVWTQMS